MAEPFSTLKKELDRTELTEKEKSDGMSLLSSFMKEHPVSEIEDNVRKTSNFNLPFLIPDIFWRIWKTRVMAGGLSFAFIIFFIMVFSAESALPGNLLYKIKTGLNEKVEMALATDLDSKINLSINLAERRLGENMALLKNGSLDSKIRSQSEWQIIKESARINAFISSVEENDTAKALQYTGKTFAVFKAHEEAFASISAENPQTATEGALLGAKVGSEAQSFLQNFLRLENKFASNSRIVQNAESTSLMSAFPTNSQIEMGDVSTNTETGETSETENTVSDERMRIISNGENLILELEEKYGIEIKEVGWFENSD